MNNGKFCIFVKIVALQTIVASSFFTSFWWLFSLFCYFYINFIQFRRLMQNIFFAYIYIYIYIYISNAVSKTEGILKVSMWLFQNARTTQKDTRTIATANVNLHALHKAFTLTHPKYRQNPNLWHMQDKQ